MKCLSSLLLQESNPEITVGVTSQDETGMGLSDSDRYHLNFRLLTLVRLGGLV